jgi:hypothetical protein
MAADIDHVRFFQDDMAATIQTIARDLRAAADAIEREAANVTTDHDAAFRAVLREYVAASWNITLNRLAELSHNVSIAKAHPSAVEAENQALGAP